jgi:GT2 family glycosyltransferase
VYERLATQLTNNGIGFYSHLVRSAKAFPDERGNAFRLGLWWFWWWNMRRLAKSYIRPGQFPRELIVGELRGSITGLRRYQQARRNAKRIAKATAEYGPVATLTRKQKPARAPKKRDAVRIAVRAIDVAEPLRTIGKPLRPERLREELASQLPAALFHDSQSINSWKGWTDARQAIAERLLPPPRSDESAPLTLPDDVSVSVVVATCDRPEDLRNCLTSLTAQQTQRPVEVIVVDNRPGSGLTLPVVAEFPGVRIIEEPIAGLSYARNAGIASSTGDIIVATDDDVTMPPIWLEALIAPFARADVMVVTGNTLPLELDTPAQQLFEQYGGLGRGYTRLEANSTWLNFYRRRAAPTWELGATANAAFRASIFADPRIGMIDETLGAGSPTGCSEDTYVFYKVLRAGYTLVYEPNAYVWHRHRRDIEALKSQLYSYS